MRVGGSAGRGVRIGPRRGAPIGPGSGAAMTPGGGADTALGSGAPDVVAGAAPGAWAALVGAELRMVARDTAGLLIPLGLPVLMLVAYGLNGAATATEGGRTVLEVIGLPVASATVLVLVGVVNVPSFLASYRRTGVLRRLAVTPVGPSTVLAAQVAVGVAQTVLGVGIAYAVAATAFGAGPPAAPLLAVGLLVLALAACFALGALVAALAPTTNSAIAAGMLLFFATGALGGMFGDPRSLPGPLSAIGEVLPFGATVQVLSAAWRGVPPDLAPVTGLAATAVLAFLGAARWFRWA